MKKSHYGSSINKTPTNHPCTENMMTKPWKWREEDGGEWEMLGAVLYRSIQLVSAAINLHAIYDL
jgi:hypothetical protein